MKVREEEHRRVCEAGGEEESILIVFLVLGGRCLRGCILVV